MLTESVNSTSHVDSMISTGASTEYWRALTTRMSAVFLRTRLSASLRSRVLLNRNTRIGICDGISYILLPSARIMGGPALRRCHVYANPFAWGPVNCDRGDIERRYIE